MLGQDYLVRVTVGFSGLEKVQVKTSHSWIKLDPLQLCIHRIIRNGNGRGMGV